MRPRMREIFFRRRLASAGYCAKMYAGKEPHKKQKGLKHEHPLFDPAYEIQK